MKYNLLIATLAALAIASTSCATDSSKPSNTTSTTTATTRTDSRRMSPNSEFYTIRNDGQGVPVNYLFRPGQSPLRGVTGQTVTSR